MRAQDTLIYCMVCKIVYFLSLLELDVNGNVINKATLSADQMNWNLLLKHMGNATQRSSSAKLNVFSKILLANIKARSKFPENLFNSKQRDWVQVINYTTQSQDLFREF